jgi:hypothetical protein
MTERYRPTPQDYAAIFEDHKVGAAILEDLIQKFARDPVMKGGIDAVLQTYANGGARKVLDHICNQINRAHDVPINEEPPDEDQTLPA